LFVKYILTFDSENDFRFFISAKNV